MVFFLTRLTRCKMAKGWCFGVSQVGPEPAKREGEHDFSKPQKKREETK
jgi:hypothetical protein